MGFRSRNSRRRTVTARPNSLPSLKTMVGIKRIIIKVEPHEQVSDAMIAAKLRELADEIEQVNRIYARDVEMMWTFGEPKSHSDRPDSV